jgi:hypothetical protein
MGLDVIEFKADVKLSETADFCSGVNRSPAAAICWSEYGAVHPPPSDAQSWSASFELAVVEFTFPNTPESRGSCIEELTTLLAILLIESIPPSC